MLTTTAPDQFISVSEAVRYNQSRRAEIIEARCRNSVRMDVSIVVYTFHFLGADGNDFVTFEGSLLATEEVEQHWSEIAEKNANLFNRGELVVTYPRCFLNPYEEEF